MWTTVATERQPCPSCPPHNKSSVSQSYPLSITKHQFASDYHLKMFTHLNIAIAGGLSLIRFQTSLILPTNFLPLLGGPSGLMLASLCHRKNLPYTVLEADESKRARTQGGSLDIHANSGQFGLKEADLLDSFKSQSRLEGEAIKLLDLQGVGQVRFHSSYLCIAGF